MPQVHRLTDPNTAGAPIIVVIQNSVFTNYLLTSVDGSPVQGHGPGLHGGPLTANGSSNVFIEYIPVNRLGDPDTCGHPRAIGSPDVYVDDINGDGVDTAAQIEPGTRIVEGRVMYENTTRGIAALKKEESKVSPNLPKYHEDPPTTDQTAPAPQPTPPEGCKNSKYFSLADSKMPIEAQMGLTKEQIQCNWIALCTNILDPLRDAGVNFNINSGFRTVKYNGENQNASKTSDHMTGCAVDITIGSSKANIKLLNKVLNKLPYSQLIYEGNWVHVAYGGRGPKGDAKVMYTYTGKDAIAAGVTGNRLPSDLRMA